jgi:predicted component of type VI protein secretion system
MQAVLVMFRSDGERRSFSITRDVTVIGRREDCDLRIPLGDISRKHARLIKEDGHLRLEDLGSSNGTHLNGQRIERDAVLQAGDSIQVGPVVFVLQVDGYPSDEELTPITVESAQAAAMFAPAAVAGAAAGMAAAPAGEDPTLDLGGYEQPGEELPAEEGQYAEEGEYAEGEPAAEAPAEEFEPLPLDDAPLELEEEPLELDDSPTPPPIASRPPPVAPAIPAPMADEEPLALEDEPLSLADEPLASEEPLALADEEPLALADDAPLELAEEEPLALADDAPLELTDDQGEPGLDMLEDLGEQPQADDELLIDFEDSDKK